jgi:hypothetical protein
MEYYGHGSAQTYGDIELVSKQFGHAYIEITARRYINRKDWKRQELIRKAFEKE